jgi:hypothetical protein
MTIAATGLPRRSFLLPALARILRVLLPVAVVVGVLGLLVGPATMKCFCGSKKSVAMATAKKYALEAHGQWSQATGLACPAHLAQLNAYTNNKDTKDPWGTEYLMRCGARGGPGDQAGIVVVSAGEDGAFVTDDDIGSDQWSRK